MPKPGYKNKVHKETKYQTKSDSVLSKKKKSKLINNMEKELKSNQKEKVYCENHKDVIKQQNLSLKKTFPEYKGLTDKEFYEALAQWADMYDKARMERYTKAFAEVIIHELTFAEEIRVPYVGMFYVQKYKGYEYSFKDKNGKTQNRRVPPRKIPIFVPCDSLINDVNEEFKTKERKHREQRGLMSYRDYTRELRKDLWEAEEEARINNSEEKIDKVNKLREKFKQTLKYRNIRSVEKILDVEEKREEQLEIRKEREERKKQREMENE